MSRSPAAVDVIIVGGGVAGLSAARVLAEARVRVLLLEREARVATQASGNNAAIFRPLELDAESAVLPHRSRALLDAWFGPKLLDRTGLLLVSQDRAAVARLAAAAVSGNVAHSVLDASELTRIAPSLQGGEAEHALLLHDGGVLDVPNFTSGLAAQAQALGAEIQTGVAVRALAVAGGRTTGVTLADGTHLAANRVVVAAGAWNASLGDASGAALPLVPMRRHLVELRTEVDVSAAEPAIWRLEDEIYYRKQGAGVLASPCDETSASIGVASAAPSAADPAAKSLLHEKLARLAPPLAGGAVVRAWSCLRTFANDRELVVGADPRVQGLYWFGGLGGRGMSVAPAAAEWLALWIRGEALLPQAAVAAPSRLVKNAEFG